MAHGHEGLFYPSCRQVPWWSMNHGFLQQDVQGMRKSLCWGLVYQAQRWIHHWYWQNWTKIKKAFKAAFTSYNTAVQARVALASLNQDQKDSLGFDKYIFSFSLLSVHSEITDYCYDQYFFINGLSIFFTFSLILLQHMIILSQGTLISLSIFSQDLQSPLCLYSLL